MTVRKKMFTFLEASNINEFDGKDVCLLLFIFIFYLFYLFIHFYFFYSFFHIFIFYLFIIIFFLLLKFLNFLNISSTSVRFFFFFFHHPPLRYNYSYWFITTTTHRHRPPVSPVPPPIITMSYPQRIVQPPSYKLNDLLDAIKQEYEAVTNEASSFRIHKDEFDRKCKLHTIQTCCTYTTYPIVILCPSN